MKSSIAALAAASLLLVGGCGSGRDDREAKTPTPTPSASTSATASETSAIPEEWKDSDEHEYDLFQGKAYTPVFLDGAAGESKVTRIGVERDCTAFDAGETCACFRSRRT